MEIPSAAGKPITANTSPSRLNSAADSLVRWAGSDLSTDQALALIRNKGKVLDPDAVPGLDMATARDDIQMGKTTPATEAVARAYREFYGLDGGAPPAAPVRFSLADGMVLNHGTTSAAAKRIMAGGFRESKASWGGAILGDGVYMTPDRIYAGAYGDTALHGPVPPGVKILDLVADGKTVNDFADEIGVGQPADEFDGDRFFTIEQQDKIKQWALDNGYDGVRYNASFDQPSSSVSEVVIYKTSTADAIVGANLIGQLGKAMGNIDAKTGLPKGLSKRSLKELGEGNPARAIQEASAMSLDRLQKLQVDIEAIKQRAIKEGC